ncbi:MAG: sulfatase-like hydrolase/transferase [Chthoniobacteraceae bacterium]
MKRISPRFVAALAGIAASLLTFAAAAERARPNILWLVNEDHGPHVGCYGDDYATTPTFDALANKGMLYRHAWSNAPVCAPARSTLICGLYATSTGAQHMRSLVPMPKGKQMVPELLRGAGYYCTNNSKTDYNLAAPNDLWNESSDKAHWKNAPAGQPFMAVFNFGQSHESQIRKRPHEQVHDPAKVRVPAYHPDTEEVRRDWAQYYDQITVADAAAGKRLRELEAAGHADDTIVFYYADHGSGMPRNKRWPYNSGLQVPLVVYIPEKFKDLRPADYQPGGSSDRLVSFVDFAPTLLSLAGIEPPDWMQGHAFLGASIGEPPRFMFGFRGRMDERHDCVRSVSDGRYVYIRNFRPDKIYGQHLNYMWQTPTTRVWERMFKAGQLNAVQSAFWKTKPPEEFYDLETDRDEVKNRIGSPEQSERIKTFRAALREHQMAIRDTGLLPEGEMHRRSEGSSPYDMAHDPAKYPLPQILDLAETASSLDPNAIPALRTALGETDSALRYWGVLGLMMRGKEAVEPARDLLVQALDDSSPDVSIAAAEALARYGPDSDLERARALLLKLANRKTNDVFTVMAALNALSALSPEQLRPIADAIRALPRKGKLADKRFEEYPSRMLAELNETL